MYRRPYIPGQEPSVVRHPPATVDGVTIGEVRNDGPLGGYINPKYRRRFSFDGLKFLGFEPHPCVKCNVNNRLAHMKGISCYCPPIRAEK